MGSGEGPGGALLAIKYGYCHSMLFICSVVVDIIKFMHVMSHPMCTLFNMIVKGHRLIKHGKSTHSYMFTWVVLIIVKNTASDYTDLLLYLPVLYSFIIKNTVRHKPVIMVNFSNLTL